MIGTGKFDFPGIRKAGVKAFSLALASTSWGASALSGPFKPLIEKTLEWVSEWLANKGLLIINVGAIYVAGEFDQSKFDKAMTDALEQAKAPGLSDAQKKAIDDEVIKAFRKFALVVGDKS